jgi:hypothetical protein
VQAFVIFFMVDELRRTEPWARFALEQARIILEHLEKGEMDEEFLRPHVLSLLQAVGLPEELPTPLSRSEKKPGSAGKLGGY